MTALAGLIRFDGSDQLGRACGRMLDAQQIYAPAGPIVWSDDKCAIGRRLYRLVPEDMFDRGPVVDSDGSKILVADVRLDNREELCRQLGVDLGEAAQLADSALVLRALEAWGDDAPDRLVGDFAFAVWEPRKMRLMLVRDPLGRRPLHYHAGKDGFAFASMAKGLHALPEVPVAPDHQATIDFVALMPEGSGSFFVGIERVMPGELLIVTREGHRRRRYWNPPKTQLKLSGPAEYAEALREQLDRAVAARLRGVNEEVASTLSGGLDSTVVAATAARLLAARGGRVVAFTAAPRAGYDGDALRETFVDESGRAAEVAALHPNIEHVVVRSDGSSPLTNLDRFFYLYERPYLNLCNGVWSAALLTEMKQRRLTVMLGGDFGNLTFSYDGMTLLPRLLTTGSVLRLAREVRALRRHGMRYGKIAAQTIGPLLPQSAWQGINRLRGKGRRLTDYTAINPRLADDLELKRRASSRKLDFSYRPWSDAAELKLWVLGRNDPGSYIKGTLGGWGIDGRDPTSDRRLVEFCLSVPDEQFLRDGIPRALARNAFSDRLPDAVRLERRKGYQAADWHEGLSAARDELRSEVERLENLPAASDLLDIGEMRRLLDDWPDGGWHEHRVTAKYRLGLLRGVSAGHFLRRASGSNQ